MPINFKDINKKIFTKENLLFFVIILITFFTDRYSKIEILDNLNDNVLYINSFVNFDLTWNTGVGFGLLSFKSNLYYNLISLIILAVIIFLVFVSLRSDKPDRIIFSIIIGGATGNFYDRVTFKAVPDFIDLHYGNFHWFTFNVADIFITIGIIGLILREFFVKSN
tara:strand:- start:9702 stop:10199 length:498 start_codon:yes stop_codon:yes gene_type:complete